MVAVLREAAAVGGAIVSAADVEVAVIGAGIMGAATAWHLARRGVSTALVERFEPAHARGASHGTTRNFNLGYDQPTPLAWLREADRAWAELESEAGEPILDRTGIVNHGPGRDLVAVAAAVRAGGFEAELLDAAEASARWPGFRFDGTVLVTPQAGRLRADRALAAFVAGARRAGAAVDFRSPVVGGSVDARAADAGGDAVVRLRIRQEGEPERELTARRVVVTAGAWTRSVLSAIGAEVPLPPLRVTQEQPAHFMPHLVPEADWPGFNHVPAPDDPATAWFPAGVYGMGSPGEGVKAGWHAVGPEVDPDRRDFLPVPELSASLRRYVAQWLPGLDPATAVETTCTYTSTPDAAFALERVGPVVVGAGFSGHGFKFAPVVGRLLADLATT